MKSSNVSRNTFRILFYAKPINKAGKLPLMVRITVNGERAVFKTTSEASPDIWDQKRGIAIGRSNEALTINTEIQNINAKITTIYNRMKLAEEHITAEKIKNELLGRVQSSHTLLKLFREHNEREEILFKANKRAASTYKRYLLTYRRIETYLKQVHHVTDIALSDLNYHFICGFAAFLYGNYAMERNSAIKLIQIFRKIIIEAIRNDYIRKDPFVGFSLALDSVDPAFLNEQELITIMQQEFYNAPYLDLTRDMFVFSCFTGLAFCDIQKLKKNEITKNFDGKLWICTERLKTKTKVKVPLLDTPIKLYEKYKNARKDEYLFPNANHQTINRHLKSIARYCDIKKNLTYHMARHTFGTTVTTLHGVALREVAKLMGHTNTKMTEHYARVLDQQLSSTMIGLNDRIKDIQNSINL